MKKSILLLSFFSSFYFGASSRLYSQELETPEESTGSNSELVQDDFFDMSIEDLLNVKIVSASRKEESAFEAPLSSWVVSRQEISAMGATSIPDALKICPGVIVREISNGTYDVSIRGGVDGFPAYNYTYNNSTILVMIDNRPVFSNFQGGTYWQNLPVGMTEIDRIEVVYGPASPLYGPNAVSGVINIITNRSKEEGVYGSGVVMYSPQAEIISSQIGAKVSEFLSLDVAANYEKRTRFSDDFYNTRNQKYQPIDSSSIPKAEHATRFPNISQSLNKIGATVNLNYVKSKDFNINLSGSTNQSIGLLPLSAGIPLSNYTNESHNLYAKGHIHGFNAQASYLYGNQGITGNVKNRSYDYRNIDLYLDYDFSFLKDKILVKPAVSYQSAYADDLKYTVKVGESGTFNNKGSINDVAGALKVEAKPIKNLRVVLAGRYDKFNHPEKGVFSYQGIVNYSINQNNISRFVTGRSYNSSFLTPTLLNSTSQVAPGIALNLMGNKNLDLMNNTMYEVGHRTRISDMFIVDVAAFRQEFKDFSVLIAKPTTFGASGMSLNYQIENLPLHIVQYGATVSLQSSFMDSKIQFRPHLTLQESQLLNYSPDYNDPGAKDNPRFGYKFAGSKEKTSNKLSKSTPTLLGGFNLIVLPIERLSVDLSGYYFSAYELHIQSEINSQSGVITNQEGGNVKAKYLVNVNVKYELAPKVHVFVNVRNILNQTSAEGYGSDKLGRMIMGGLSFNY